MTAFTPANLPSNCNTVEKVHVWSSALLRTINPNNTILETELQKEFIASNQQVQLPDGTMRNIDRISIELDPLYVSGDMKLWEAAREISNTAIPVTFTTNG